MDFQERKWKHFSELRKNTHGNRKLQRAYNKYGAEAFAMEPIITCAKSMLIWYEQQFLDQLQPEYNICKRAGSPVGTTNTPEGKASQIAKQSKSLTHNGETHTYREWDVIVGLAPGGIRRRVHAFGASSEKLFVPPSELWEAQKPLMGGDHWSGKTMSIEHKQKMGISQKYRREQEATRYTHAGSS